MISASYSELRTGLKAFLNKVDDNNETLIIKRGVGKAVVILSLQEYNSIMETLHLLGSKANAKRLFQSIEEMEGNRNQVREL